MMCGKCSKITGTLVFIAGVLLLLQDLGLWDVWNISAWTFVLLIAGVTACAHSSCKDCAAMCRPEPKPVVKKKRR